MTETTIKEGMKVKITDAAGVEHVGTISEIEEIETEFMVWATISDIEPPVIERSEHVSKVETWPVKVSDIVQEA